MAANPYSAASVFGYPCSLDGGYSSSALIAHILYRRAEAETHGDSGTAAKLVESARARVGADVNIDDPKALAAAVAECDKRTQMKFDDKTDMAQDVRVYEEMFDTMQGSPVLVFSNLASEFASNEHAKSCLGRIKVGPMMSAVVLVGHGLTVGTLELLHAQSQSADEPGGVGLGLFKMSSASELAELVGATGSKLETMRFVFDNATAGSVNVFDSGLITPHLVLQALYQRDAATLQAEQRSTVVLLVDACYSGAWCEHFNAQLQATPLRALQLVLQTACAAEECSYYGGLSTALSKLQAFDEATLRDIRITSNLDDSPMWRHPQSPQLLVSTPEDGCSICSPGIFELHGRRFLSGNAALGTLSFHGIGGEPAPRVWVETAPVADPATGVHMARMLTTDKKGQDRMAMHLVNFNAEVYNIHVHYNADGSVPAVTFEPYCVTVAPAKYKYRPDKNKQKSHLLVVAGDSMDKLATRLLVDSGIAAAPAPGSAPWTGWAEPAFNVPGMCKRDFSFSRHAAFDGAYHTALDVLQRPDRAVATDQQLLPAVGSEAPVA